MTMNSPSLKGLLALTMAAALTGPALAQQGGSGQGNQMNQQRGQTSQQQPPRFGGQLTPLRQQYREEQGRVIAMRPVRVRGVSTPNYIVMLETQPGRRVAADIGQGVEAANIRQGTNLSVRGRPVRVGDQGAILLADAVQVGNRMYDVNRPAYRRTGTGDRQAGSASRSTRTQERAALRRQLREAGFQRVQILDTAFLVQASMADGRTVLMMVDPPRAALLAVGNDDGQQNPPGQNKQQGTSGMQPRSSGSGG